jgi:hypothetical protein
MTPVSFPVCHGASLRCSFGGSPGRLLVAPDRAVCVGARPVAQVLDHRPFVNIVPFGVCAAGPRPRRCMPETLAPWAHGAAGVGVASAASLHTSSTLLCLAGGVIRIAPAEDLGVRLP